MVYLSGCGANVAPQETGEAGALARGVTTEPERHPGCGDHADEHDDAALRAQAAATVSHRANRPPKTPRVAAKILGFNDFHGQLPEGRLVGGRPVGGAAVLASYLKTAATGFEGRSLIIHAGDFVGASPPQSALLQDEPSIQFLNVLANANCDGAAKADKQCNVIGTLGNHEFDEGKDELLRLIYGGNHANGPFLQNPYRGARFPYVNANVVVQGKRRAKHLLPPYVVRKLDGVKVGVIGAVLKETPTIVTPTGVAGLSFLDEATAINEQVHELKCAGVHSIIVTIHQGAAQSPSYTTPTDPAATLGSPISTIVSALDDEVDLVISGHSHSFSNALVKNQSGHEILVTQAFSASTAYADIDLEIERQSGDVIAKSARIVTTYSDQAPGNVRDTDVQAIVDQANAVTAPLVNRAIATFTADITRTQNAAGESSLGNLIADAQRASQGTDFAFMNPGGIRADLAYAKAPSIAADADGLALWGELFTIQPFGNSLVRLSMTGQQIYDLLNQQFAVSRFLQISGLTYTWDASLPAASRVVEVLKDGVPIDVTATYSVTANNFIAAGGDGFTVFLQGSGNVGGAVDLDAFIAYVSSLTQPFAPPALGRITRLN
ncbi:MAG: bifunctional metallophosphatase/5'-nucleotidase [Polyangiaceae bacterium]